MTPILGAPSASMEQAQRWAATRDATLLFIETIIPALYAAGSKTGVDPAVLVAQSAKEIGFGRFGRALTIEHRNTCGLKVPKPGADDSPDSHERFSSWRHGAEAHANHLRWPYCGLDPIGHTAPRSAGTATASWAGTVRTVERLGGKWAPNHDYGHSIIRGYLQPMRDTGVMRIITREQWGARYPDGAGPAPLPAQELWLHHSVTSGTGPAAVRNLEGIGHNRFGYGISYTFVVDQAGGIYEGHSIDRQGTHTGGRNSRSRAICGIGNFQVDKPSSQMIEAMGWLVRHGHEQGWWPPQLTGGHRDVKATACPGDHLYREIAAINTLASLGATEEEIMHEVQVVVACQLGFFGTTNPEGIVYWVAEMRNGRIDAQGVYRAHRSAWEQASG